jgi:sirohydrochlorin ferrochelatase
MTGIVLFSHGSTLCGAGTALEEHAERLRPQFGIVEVGYMNYSTPTFEEAVAKIVAAGATIIIVTPFFLVPGYFVTKSLPDRVNAIRETYPQIHFEVAEPLGADPLLADAVIDAALNPLADDQWREGLNAAARLCRYSVECPLYGSEECPPTSGLKAQATIG